MDTHHHKEKAAATHHHHHGEAERLKVEAPPQSPPPRPVTAPASPPSASSSPSHEFSFTISLHSSSSTSSVLDHQNNKSKTTPASFAIDLSPADDIFFHGHLLPLQFLSHLPVSPRSSTNSLDSFTLPVRDIFDDQSKTPAKEISSSKNNGRATGIDGSRDLLKNKNNSCSSLNKKNLLQSSKNEGRGRPKSKSFSIFGLPKWRKECENREKEEVKEQSKNKRKMRFDVSHILKRYVRMVRPLLLFRGRSRDKQGQFRRQTYSFSGNLRNGSHDPLVMRGGRRRTGEYSAPASMRTSPTNSGLLVATNSSASNNPASNSVSDSTMEELHAAIQAAIAHCKNSISTEDNKIKC